jgi:gas vesicle protein
MKSSILALATLLIIASGQSFADENLKNTTAELGKDTKRGVNNAVREVKDKTCELVNGKMECAVEKTKHSIQRGADKVEDAVD